MGIAQVRWELQSIGKDFTDKQITIALKELKKEIQLLEEHAEKSK